MGSNESRILDSEEENWKKPHRLIYDEDLRLHQLGLLPNFGKKLKICYLKKIENGMAYQHWFITDDTWVIEFWTRILVLEVHNDPKIKRAIIDEDFFMTDEIMERMKKICGATNFSWALRNSEHAAR